MFTCCEEWLLWSRGVKTRCLCDLGRLGTVVLPLRRVALDFSRGRLRLLVEVWAGLGFLQRGIVLFSSQELLHSILQQLHVRLVAVFLQTGKERDKHAQQVESNRTTEVLSLNNSLQLYISGVELNRSILT